MGDSVVVRRLADGGFEFSESYDLAPVAANQELVLEFQEAAKSGAKKKLVRRMAAMHVGPTRNRTEYPAEELAASIPSWTTPYPCPIIKDHGRPQLFGSAEVVDDIVGRIEQAYMGKDEGVEALMFKVGIMDPDAIEKVLDGRYNTISIGVRCRSAVCSICGTDLAKEPYCGHERGRYYVRDEDQDSGKPTLCVWIMGGLEGREVSFVVSPSDSKAGIRNSADDPDHVVEIPSSEGELDTDSLTFCLEDVTSEDEAALELIESEIKNGSPVSDADVVPTPAEEEEEVEKPHVETPEAGEQPVVEVSSPTASDVTPEGAEEPTVEGTDPEVDGLETEPASEGEPASEPEGEGEAEGSEPAAESDPEVPAVEGEEPPTEPVVEATASADALLERTVELEVANHQLMAELYVEMGLHDGFLAGESDTLIAQHVEMENATLADLIKTARERRTAEPLSPEIKGKVASPARPIEDDKKANKDRRFVVNVKTEKGSHRIVVEDDGEKKSRKVTPRLR